MKKSLQTNLAANISLKIIQMIVVGQIGIVGEINKETDKEREKRDIDFI